MRGDDIVKSPAVRSADIHKLDVADNDSAAFEVLGDFDEFFFVDAALNDNIDLYRRNAGVFCGLNTCKSFFNREINVVEILINLRIHGVQRNG